MPRYTTEAGVVVDIPAETAERLGGYTPVETPADGDPEAVKAWLAAEQSHHGDVAAWLDAEATYHADVAAWLDAEKAADKSGGGKQGANAGPRAGRK